MNPLFYSTGFTSTCSNNLFKSKRKQQEKEGTPEDVRSLSQTAIKEMECVKGICKVSDNSLLWAINPHLSVIIIYMDNILKPIICYNLIYFRLKSFKWVWITFKVNFVQIKIISDVRGKNTEQMQTCRNTLFNLTVILSKFVVLRLLIHNHFSPKPLSSQLHSSVLSWKHWRVTLRLHHIFWFRDYALNYEITHK